MTKIKARARKILSALEKAYPEANCTLDFRNPFQLLISTILSAQATDVSVNKVTPMLFAKFPDAESFADAKESKIRNCIRSIGLYKTKAQNIRNACRIIMELHNGKVPATMKELTELPGVGRKTANIVLGNAFGKAEGIAVDTHVTRLSGRLGLSAEKDYNKIEKDLMRLFPSTKWVEISHMLIAHGRKVCPARSPKCGECVLRKSCPSAFAFEKKGGKAKAIKQVYG
ncbi:MAG: endonuclease III [archaeon]